MYIVVFICTWQEEVPENIFNFVWPSCEHEVWLATVCMQLYVNYNYKTNNFVKLIMSVQAPYTNITSCFKSVHTHTLLIIVTNLLYTTRHILLVHAYIKHYYSTLTPTHLPYSGIIFFLVLVNTKHYYTL